MDWWDFGEHVGYSGNELALRRVTCAFCNAEGNFERVNHVEKKHPATKKILNFDTFKCGNCGNKSATYFLSLVSIVQNTPQSLDVLM